MAQYPMDDNNYSTIQCSTNINKLIENKSKKNIIIIPTTSNNYYQCNDNNIIINSENKQSGNCDLLDKKVSLNNDLIIIENEPLLYDMNDNKENNDDINNKPVLRVQFNSDDDDKIGIKTDDRISSMPITINKNNSNSNSNSSIINDKNINLNSSSSSSSTNSDDDDDDLDISEAHPPDGGWGWIIVFASFIVNLIADGITFSFGVIFIEFLKYFGENRGTTAWIGSLFMAMPLLSGPIASFLTDRYGCRKVTIFGSILSCIGFIISSHANSMTILCITFGGLAGFGLSLCYVASVVIVAYYFDKKRSLATGLAVCGSGIGTFLFAPFIHILQNEYGWRGATLILAGFLLNLAICGALMRDLPWTHEKLKIAAKKRKLNRYLKRKHHHHHHINKNNSSIDTFSISNNSCTTNNNTPSLLLHQSSIINIDNKNQQHQRLYSSLINLPTYFKNNENIPLEIIELLLQQQQHKNVYNVLITNYPNLLTLSRSFSDSGRLNDPNYQTIKTSLKECLLKHNNNFITTTTTIPPPPTTTTTTIKNSKTQAFLKDLRIHRLSVTYRGAMLNINRYRLRASSCPDIYRNSMTTIAKEKSQWYAGLWDFWDLIIDMFDFSHFYDSKFLLFALSNFLLYTWYDVPYVYLTDHATNLGYTEEDASLLISIIGIINMIGEIIFGWAGDRSWANASIIYAVCMGLCGGVLALVPLIHSYWFLCILSGAFGFFIAANYSLTCIILVELITLDRFTNAYGLLLMVQGVANLIGPPLGGWLRDITNTYDLSFYLAGLFIALSGLLLIILPIMKSYKKYINSHYCNVITERIEKTI